MLDVSKASSGLQMLAPEDPEEEPDEPVRGADAIIRAQMVCIHGLTRLITHRLHSQISAKRAICDARLQVRPCAWLCHMDGHGLLWALLLCQHHCEVKQGCKQWCRLQVLAGSSQGSKALWCRAVSCSSGNIHTPGTGTCLSNCTVPLCRLAAMQQ